MPGDGNDLAESILYGTMSKRNIPEPIRPGWWPADGIDPADMVISGSFENFLGWSGRRDYWIAKIDRLPTDWKTGSTADKMAPTRRYISDLVYLVTYPERHADVFTEPCVFAEQTEWDQVLIYGSRDSYIIDQQSLAAVTYLVGPELEWSVVSKIRDIEAEYRNDHHLCCRLPGSSEILGIIDVNLS